MIHTPIIAAIKYTLTGKIGAALVSSAPVILALEISSHTDAIIAAVPPTAAIIVGIFTLKKAQNNLHILVNSRMTELLDSTKKSSHSEGKEEERTEERDRKSQDT